MFMNLPLNQGAKRRETLVFKRFSLSWQPDTVALLIVAVDKTHLARREQRNNFNHMHILAPASASTERNRDPTAA